MLCDNSPPQSRRDLAIPGAFGVHDDGASIIASSITACQTRVDLWVGVIACNFHTNRFGDVKTTMFHANVAVTYEYVVPTS